MKREYDIQNNVKKQIQHTGASSARVSGLDHRNLEQKKMDIRI